MAYRIKPSDEEIDDTLNRATEGVDHGSKWPGLSYEEGVQRGLEWMLGFADDNPMDE